jgi:cardiolipin synthase
MINDWINWLSPHWVTITVILHISLSLLTSLHVLLYKENERTSLAWIGLVVLSPVIGSMFYWIFGINRIQRLAQKKHPPIPKHEAPHPKSLAKFFDLPKHWHGEIISGYSIYPSDYSDGNTVEPLINGDNAYPAMLKSIEEAKTSIVLASYIFDYDEIGRKFVDALANAHERGVIVHVLLDGIGIRYSWHKSDRALKKLGVKSARFLPTISLTGIRFINLRNHRKILCVDGELAYVGGMNISKNNVLATATSPIDDVHFKVRGPVVDQISQVFLEDWYFATGEMIDFPQYEAPANNEDKQKVIAKVIQDGPDEHHNKVKWTLINALSCAQTSVKILTPYFIPDRVLMASLHAAALRGVSIEIIVPHSSNIPFLDWVMQANAARIIEHGIKLYKNTRPFDHSKVVLIDDIWSFVGSTNWDSRSLEFNFEINLECFDKSLNSKLSELFESKRNNAKEVLEPELNDIPMYKKVRNNLFRLFSPYL